jgi:PD-(D/E)XK nuclease superfamily
LKGKLATIKKEAAQELKRWSYSSWSSYEECGARFAARYLEKIPEAPSPAMARGTDIHTKAEYWLQGKLDGPVPNALKKMEAEFNGLRALKPRVEQWYGVNKDFSVAKYNSWCVGKIDADVLVDDGKELIVIDHKSGRMYADKHQEQASLYGALGLAHFPKVKKVTAEFWYLDMGETLTWSWSAAQAKTLQAKWITRGIDVMEHKNLEPRPGYQCRWCSLSKANGGNCKVG